MEKYQGITKVTMENSSVELIPNTGFFSRYLTNVTVDNKEGHVNREGTLLSLEEVTGKIYLPSHRSIDVRAKDSKLSGIQTPGTYKLESVNSQLVNPLTFSRSNPSLENSGWMGVHALGIGVFSAVPYALTNWIAGTEVATEFIAQDIVAGAGVYAGLTANKTNAFVVSTAVAATAILGPEVAETCMSVKQSGISGLGTFAKLLGGGDVAQAGAYVGLWTGGKWLKDHYDSLLK